MTQKKRAANRTKDELLQDVTERKRADEALRTGQSNAQKYLDIVEVMLAAVNEKGEITLINRKGCRVLGYKESELLGKNWFAVCLPEQISANVEAVFHELLAGNIEPLEYSENPVLTKSGEERVIAWHNSVLKDETGRIVGVLSSGEDITERREMEEKLRESEQRYRLLVDSAGEGIGVIQGTQFCFANPKLLEISGFSEEEIMSRSIFDFALPEDREMLAERLNKKLAGEALDTDYVFRIIAKDKSVRWVRSNSVTIEWEGRPATLNFFADVSDRVAMEEKIKTAAREWHTTFDAINDAISLLDADRRVLRANKTLARLLGKSFAEIIGFRCYELLQCERESSGPCPFERMLKSRRRETEELLLRECRCEGIVDPIFAESGHLKGAVYIVKDIGERRRSEEQIRRQNEFLNTVMESLTHPFYIVDVRDYSIVMANPAARKSLSTRGSTCYQITHGRDEPCTGSRHPCPIQEVKESKKPARVEHIHTGRQGGKRNLEIHAYPIFDEAGEVKQIIEYTIDISERRKAEKMAGLQQEQLLQADKMISLGILVSGVAHEINNPNNSIALNAPFLDQACRSVLPILDEYYRENESLQVGGIEYGKFREKAPFLFSGILDSSRRIQHIVRELKSFSRKDAADTQAPVDLNAVVKSAVGLMSNIIKKSTRNFQATYGRGLPRVLGDFRKLEQVIINLVQNACQALAAPGKGISLSTCYDRENRQVVVIVEDEGVGIPKEDLKHIADPFFTTKRSSGGTGLGLSVSQRIVNDHSGTLHFSSTPGEGTTVEVRFPLLEKKP